MDLIDRINQLKSRIAKQRDMLSTEEATKNALVMPFLSALGYDVFDPTQVIPEFTADVGVKKGEKVDYAVKKDDELIFLIECKAVGSSLSKANASQLYRYFSVTDARFAILTNGIAYRFYSDIDAPNKMDAHPFLEINLEHLDDYSVEELKKFTRDSFDLEDILTSASTLKYKKAIKEKLREEVANPSEDLVKHLASDVYGGKRFTAQVMEQFSVIVKEAFREFLRDHVRNRLDQVLDEPSDAPTQPAEREIEDTGTDGIETTQEEIEAFQIVRAICASVVDPERIVMRDTKTYCGVLLDDNNRKPIVRLRFNAASVKYLGLFDADKNEEKQEIGKVSEIYGYADHICKSVGYYDGE